MDAFKQLTLSLTFHIFSVLCEGYFFRLAAKKEVQEPAGPEELPKL